MKNLLLLSLMLGLAVLPGTARAADGDQFTGASTSKGDWRIIAAITICDNKSDADSDCTQFDLQDSPGQTDRLVFARREGSDCTGDPTLTVTTSEEAAATFEYNLGSAGTDLTVNDATPRVTLMVDQGASSGRFLNFNLTDMTACHFDGEGAPPDGIGTDWLMLFVTKAGAGE